MDKRRIVAGAVDDMVMLDPKDINENGIIRNLENRFNNDDIYTYIGNVLVSVNPFKQIRGLYDKDLARRYYGRQTYENAPHVYALAEEAYRGLLSMGKDQCILVSGESGAGKTEAAKKIMEYISIVSNDRAEKGELDVKYIKEALLNSNPVLEAFGNAQTLRNDNSSRFGKYMVIQFDYNGVPLGGRITNYLLEKPRVVGQTAGERSFHIFYQLCASGPRNLNLGSASDFNYICGTTKVNSINDSNDFKVMDAAMGKVGVSSGDKDSFYKLVAAVLHLGNVEFQTARGDKCEVARGNALEMAADLLDVSAKDLAKALTHRTIESRTERVTSPLTTVDECVKTRDALAKALYSRGFQKLVELINKTIHTDMCELSLGVLDIYGFEIFEHNSFGQLCINYANEKLQQLFIELTLRMEQEEYEREGIKWTHVDYFDNKIVCDLIEGTRPAGVFAYLDEESIYPKGTDVTYLKKMESNLARHKHYQSLATKTNRDPTEFTIKHYAGDVIYSVDGMLDANKDTLFRDLLELIGDKSRSAFLNELFPEGREKHDGKKPITAGKAFVRDMKALIEDLEKCTPHYIRTIKSNSQKRGGVYEDELVRHQVRYLGLVENIRVRRAGYAFRQPYDFFVKRYKMCSPNTWPRTSGRDKNDTETILRALHIDDYEMGKTKVFISDAKSVFKLEESREKKLHDIAKIMQKTYRAYKARLYFLRLREESVHLLHGKKCRRGSWVLYFLGDYVFAQDNEIITSQIDGRVKFADYVNVMNPKNKMVKHLLVMTDRTMYFFTTKYDIVARNTNVDKLILTVSFRDIKNFGLSQFADGFMIMDYHSDKPKPEPTVIMESVRKAEIVTVLNEEFEKAVRKKLDLRFQNEYQIVVKKKTLFGSKIMDKLLHFVESDLNGLGNRADYYIAASKADNPEFKTVLKVQVSPLLASEAQIQLDSEIPDRLNRFKGRPGQKKKIPYAGYRR